MQHTELLFVQITSECNMNCSYCPFSYENFTLNREKSFKAQIKSVETTLSSDLFTKNSFNSLVLYGGECLLHFEQIKKIVDEYKTHKKDGKITLCTNGALIDSVIISYCKFNKIHLAINMDGDFNVTKNIKTFSEENWEVLLKNLKILKLKNISFDFSTTITPRFIENFDTQVKFLESLSPRMIGFNFLRDEYSQKKFGINDSDDYLRKAMSLVFKHNSSLNFNRIKKLNDFKNEKQTPDCICSGLGLTILSDGNYTTCGIFPNQKYEDIKNVIRISKENQYKLFFCDEKGDKIKDMPTFGGGCAKLFFCDNKKFSYYNAVISFNQFKYENL